MTAGLARRRRLWPQTHMLVPSQLPMRVIGFDETEGPGTEPGDEAINPRARLLQTSRSSTGTLSAAHTHVVRCLLRTARGSRLDAAHIHALLVVTRCGVERATTAT